LKIRALKLKHFKKFDQPVAVERFGDGLNLIAGPNETGKSTLMLALRAVLFERHGSKAQAVKDFSPHQVTGAAPEIGLDFEIGGERYSLQKRFLSRPMACLQTPDGRRFEGAEAEAELKRLLGLNPSEKTSTDKESPAHFSVLLTPQTRSFQQPALADGTRHSLEAAIAEDIADLGSQSEVDGLLAELQAEHGVFIDGRGKPKGRYRDVEARLSALEVEIDDLQRKRDELDQDVDALETANAGRQALLSAEDGDGLKERLAMLETDRAHAVRRQALENRHLAARQQVQKLTTKRDALQSRIEERRRLQAEIVEIEEKAETARDALVQSERGLAEVDGKLALLVEQRDRLAARRRDLEALAQQVERRRHIDATLSALATDVRFDLDQSALGRVTIEGEPQDVAHRTVQVTEGLAIDIENVGRITVEPKTEPLREALNARTKVESAMAEQLGKLALADPEPERIEALWQSTTAELEDAEAAHATLESTLSEDRRRAAEAKAALDALDDRRERLTAGLAELDRADDHYQADPMADVTAINAEITEAQRALDAAAQALQAEDRAKTEGNAPPLSLDQLDAEIAELRSRIEERRSTIDDVNKKVVALESAIAKVAGFGLDERIDQLERQRQLLVRERDAFALDHQALTLLQTTLRDAAYEAKATFNAPLAKRLAPYIQELLSEAMPLVASDFSIRALDRNGLEEPFLQLSDGTREQIAILARLAFADMLMAQGLPALVVLDDALAFSDSGRLERMIAILEEAAKRMQIIVLTCREERFAGIEATRPKILSAAERAPSAA